jgi:hypothetical protein
MQQLDLTSRQPCTPSTDGAFEPGCWDPRCPPPEWLVAQAGLEGWPSEMTRHLATRLAMLNTAKVVAVFDGDGALAGISIDGDGVALDRRASEPLGDAFRAVIRTRTARRYLRSSRNARQAARLAGSASLRPPR